MSELYHHGIKGQKWGVRRYQNADGSLTEEGYQRYGLNSDGSRNLAIKHPKNTKQIRSRVRLAGGVLGAASGLSTLATVGAFTAGTVVAPYALVGAGAAAVGKTAAGTLAGHVIGHIVGSASTSRGRRYIKKNLSKNVKMSSLNQR